MNNPRHFEVLKALCDLPTAPYCEQHVIAWLLAWAGGHSKFIRPRRDRAGNLYLEYRGPRPSARRSIKQSGPLVIEAHMDHPGFLVSRQRRDGKIEAEFRGGVRPSFFAGARAKFWINDLPAVGTIAPIPAKGRWISTRVIHTKQTRGKSFLQVVLEPTKERLPVGTIGMWDLPDASLGGGGKEKHQLFTARVCDDLAGVAAIICLLEDLIAQKVPAHVIGLFSRAEEVGFAGVLAVCENGWIPKNALVIGLETSKASPTAPQGAGPVIRVGDRTGLFSPGLTHFLTQAAGHITDDDPSFKYQRKLMDGGTCNSTAFTAWGYDSAAICLALGNYHNMTVKGETGWRTHVGGKAGKGIASETIHLGDFAGMVRILVEAAKRITTYKPGFATVRERLAKLHREEQKHLLYQTSDQV